MAGKGHPIGLCSERLFQRYYEAFSAGDYELANTILLRIHYFFLGSSKDTARMADWVLAKFYDNILTDPDLSSIKLAGVRNTLQLAVYVADVVPDGFVKRITIWGGVSDYSTALQTGSEITGKVAEEITGAYHWPGHTPTNNIFIIASVIYPRNQGLKVWNPSNDGLTTIISRRGLIIGDQYRIEQSRCGENGAMTCAVDALIDPDNGCFVKIPLKEMAEHDFTCPDQDVCSRSREMASSTEKMESELTLRFGVEAPTELEYYDRVCAPHNRRTGGSGNGEEGPGSLIPFSPYTFAGLCLPPPNAVRSGLNRILTCSERLEEIYRSSEYENPACPSPYGTAEGEDGSEGGGEGGGGCGACPTNCLRCDADCFCITQDSCEGGCPSDSLCQGNRCVLGAGGSSGPGGETEPSDPCAGVSCGAREECYDGLCLNFGVIPSSPDNPCLGVMCPSGYSCSEGFCVSSEGAFIYSLNECSGSQCDIINNAISVASDTLMRGDVRDAFTNCDAFTGSEAGFRTMIDQALVNTIRGVQNIGGSPQSGVPNIGIYIADDYTLRGMQNSNVALYIIPYTREHNYEIVISPGVLTAVGLRTTFPNLLAHELLHVFLYESGIPSGGGRGATHHRIMSQCNTQRFGIPAYMPHPDDPTGGFGSCSVLDEILRECVEEDEAPNVNPLTPYIQCANMLGGGCDPVPGELQPVLDCLASQEGATTIYSGALIKASRPGPDCQNDDCCDVNPITGRCNTDNAPPGVEVGEFTASLIGCGPAQTPVDSNMCVQPLCNEGEEPDEDSVGGITCVPAGTVPRPQPVGSN